MAITVAKPFLSEDVWGKHRVIWADVTLDSSYPTNGYTSALGFSPSAFGLSDFLEVVPVGIKAAASGVVEIRYDYLNKKLMAFRVATFTPAGTVAAPVFTGSALAAHRHTLHFQTSAAANAVTAQANQLRTAAAAFDVAGVADSAGEGGVVDVTGGTPAGTNSAPAFTGTAQGQIALAEVSNAVNLSTVIVRLRLVELN